MIPSNIDLTVGNVFNNQTGFRFLNFDTIFEFETINPSDLLFENYSFASFTPIRRRGLNILSNSSRFRNFFGIGDELTDESRRLFGTDEEFIDEMSKICYRCGKHINAPWMSIEGFCQDCQRYLNYNGKFPCSNLYKQQNIERERNEQINKDIFNLR